MLEHIHSRMVEYVLLFSQHALTHGTKPEPIMHLVFYLLFLPEFPKAFTYCSYFIPLQSPVSIIPVFSLSFYCDSDS